MHQLDNTQLWNEFFSTSNKKSKRKMRNELAMRGFSQEAIAEREAAR
jgi:SOS response regulatory protein OraA/RecX